MIAILCASASLLRTLPVRKKKLAAPGVRPARRPPAAALASPVKPVTLTGQEVVNLLRQYRSDPDLSPGQRAEALAWITGLAGRSANRVAAVEAASTDALDHCHHQPQRSSHPAARARF